MARASVALFIFNRPEHTRRVVARVAEYRPRQLLVVADGPRSESEAPLCAQARAVVEEVAWDCEVKYQYAKENLGCRRRVSSGLDWVFAETKEAIILEDDCLPNPTFFRYCEELLERYRRDTRVMTISGNNFDPRRAESTYSYYFSRCVHCWGWASWRRAWEHYDVNVRLWSELRSTAWLEGVLGSAPVVRAWKSNLDACLRGQVDTWDYQWVFASWLQNGLTIVPAVNLVENIGFGAGATHTFDAGARISSIGGQPMHFPLQHPPFVLLDRDSDMAVFRAKGEYAPSIARRACEKGWSRLRGHVRLRTRLRSVYTAGTGRIKQRAGHAAPGRRD